MMYTTGYESPLGGMTMASDGNALTGLWFDGQKYFGCEGGQRSIFCAACIPTAELPVFRETATWLDTYFSGKDPGFTPPLLLKCTEFRMAVWKILLTIPYGSTMTYGEIAAMLAGQGRMSAQAVGGAVGHNPVSLIIPCHRVVGKDGLTGYAGGLSRKALLLALEGGKPHDCLK